MPQTSNARRQARQRAKGRPVTVILPQPAADALEEIQRRHGPKCTQLQAISMALQLMQQQLNATPPTP